MVGKGLNNYSLIPIIMILLFTNCSTNETNIIHFSNDGSTYAIFTNNSGNRGELIDFFPAGNTDFGKITTNILNSKEIKNDSKRYSNISNNVFVITKNEQYTKNIVKISKIHYWTRDFNGRSISCSALLLTPVCKNNKTSFPLVQIVPCNNDWKR